ncbi:MAG: YeeE/YedE family protein [Alphaproteobacteria bacterium]|nr:YeeE/YedE family protein [Alphaproteobacteria bacterium]
MVTTFTPVASLLGGVMIGLAAVLLMLSLGRIAGVTGIVTGMFFPADRSDWSWRAAMVAGMVTAPLLYLAASGSWPELSVPVSSDALVFGGVLVGIGVILGSGCTSGHGVCGMARLSMRSVAATATFMLTTAVTVYVVRHLL